MGPSGARDKHPCGLWGVKAAWGWRPCPRIPCIRCAAAPLPQQRSPASAAASRSTGLGPRSRGQHSTSRCPLPTWPQVNCPWVSLHTPSWHPQPPPPHLLFSWEKGDAHAAVSAAPSQHSTQGFFFHTEESSGQRGDEALSRKNRLKPLLHSAHTQRLHREAIPHEVTHCCVIFEATSRQRWHFKNFTGQPRWCRSSDWWARLAGGAHSPHRAARKAMVAFAKGEGLHAGGGRKLVFCTNITEN